MDLHTDRGNIYLHFITHINQLNNKNINKYIHSIYMQLYIFMVQDVGKPHRNVLHFLKCMAVKD